MGNPFLLQGCLRLDEKEIPKVLELGKSYPFLKKEHRIYQLNVAMDLWTNDWKFICRIVITEYSLGNNETKGFFVPVKLFSDEERKVITKIYVSDSEIESLNFI
mgnify:CR=1 FL=1